jgi:hypothetical protein
MARSVCLSVGSTLPMTSPIIGLTFAMPPNRQDVPLDLAGSLEHITDTFANVSSRKLVVLGAAGGGKTSLAFLFIRDMLADGLPPKVPLYFSLANWNPTEDSLRDLLVEQLTKEYVEPPELRRKFKLKSSKEDYRHDFIAAHLIDLGWILPVLDGFDEIAPGCAKAPSKVSMKAKISMKKGYSAVASCSPAERRSMSKPLRQRERSARLRSSSSNCSLSMTSLPIYHA